MDVGLKEVQQTERGLRLFAIGDLNNDKQNDIVALNEDMNGFSVHYFRQDDYKFRNGKENKTAPVVTVENGYIIT